MQMVSREAAGKGQTLQKFPLLWSWILVQSQYRCSLRTGFQSLCWWSSLITFWWHCHRVFQKLVQVSVCMVL